MILLDCVIIIIMAKIISTKFSDNLTVLADYLIEATEYKDFSQTILNQLIKSVEVPGFRKGKVPEDIAIKNIDPQKLQTTVIRELIQKYAPDGVSKVREFVESESRKLLDAQVDILSEELGENKQGEFTFRIVGNLLPQVDISKVKQIQYKSVDDTDLPERISKEEFLEREKSNFLANINQDLTNKGVTNAENLIDAFEKHEEFKNRYQNEENLKNELSSFYDQETDYIKKDIQHRKVIKDILKAVPSFDISKSKLDTEVSRITNLLQTQATTEKKSIEEVFEKSGLPNPKETKPAGIVGVTTLVNDYVLDEMLLMWILRYVYETEIDEKIKQEEVDELTSSMKKDPKKFGIPANLSSEELEAVSFDRLMRSKSFSKILTWVDENSK
jgi:FKBP-type peptidyl-prolyl cis-trans isomerase (trigger factor)